MATQKINIQDIVLNPNGTVTINSQELYNSIAAIARMPGQDDDMPRPDPIRPQNPLPRRGGGPGSPGHPLPEPPKPIITITWEF